LIRKNTFYCRYGVFKVHAGRRPALPENDRHHQARSLKTQQRAESTYIEVDVISRRTESSDEVPREERHQQARRLPE